MSKHGQPMSQTLAEMQMNELKMNDPKLNKIFDKLKKGDKVKLKTSSTISKGSDFVDYIVKSKNVVNKGRVEKITLATVGNEKAVKKFLYKRDGKVTFAIGDMGASIDDIREKYSLINHEIIEEIEVEELDEGMAYKFAAVDKKGLVIGFASKESDAKDMARRNKGRVVTLTKPLAPKKGDMMVNRPFPDEMDKFPTNTSATQGKRMEEVELDERKFEAGKSASGYDIFHKDFSSAMQHATAFAKKKGQPIKKDEIDNKVATGPKKPSSGKENSYTLETEKGKMWSVQVYNMGSKFELNMYLTSSHVPEGEELDEGMKMNDPKLLKMFDKLKKGSKIKLKTSSTISQGKDYVEYIVKSKNTVNKGKVEKITLATVGNEKAVKKYLYKRDGTVGFAIGDMGASIDDIKESTNEVPENMAAYLAAITKQLGER